VYLSKATVNGLFLLRQGYRLQPLPAPSRMPPGRLRAPRPPCSAHAERSCALETSDEQKGLWRHAPRKRIETFAYPSVCSWTVSRSTASNRRSRSSARSGPIFASAHRLVAGPMVSSIKAATTSRRLLVDEVREALERSDRQRGFGVRSERHGFGASLSLLSHLVPVTCCGNALRW
jgi:hypothetical protein